MSMDFRRKLPIPLAIKEEFPLPEEMKEIKKPATELRVSAQAL